MPRPTINPNDFFVCPSPSDDIVSVNAWVQETYDNIMTNNKDRQKVVLFENFPPEYVDCYQALQKKLAENIPDEQGRPLICVEFNGSQSKLGISSVGLAGGTGPLSDAKIAEQMIKHLAELGEDDSISQHRQAIKRQTASLTAVLYSFPPPRATGKLLHEGKNYRRLYKLCRETFPCDKLHILTNTGHLRKKFFEDSFYLGDKIYGSVNDMVTKVTQFVKSTKLREDEKVLVLGTDYADRKGLYKSYFKKLDIETEYPSGEVGEMSARDYLQYMIDKIKAGKIDGKEGDNTKTNGELLVDFIISQYETKNIETNKVGVILLACTELSLLKASKMPNSDKSYFEHLQDKAGEDVRIVDSEDIFVNSITRNIRASHEHRLGTKMFNINLTRSNPDLKKDKLLRLKDEVVTTIKYVEDYIEKLDSKIGEIPKNPESQEKVNRLTAKRSILTLAVNYLKEPTQESKEKLTEAKSSHPETWMETLSSWGSGTLFMVDQCEAIADHILQQQIRLDQVSGMG